MSPKRDRLEGLFDEAGLPSEIHRPEPKDSLTTLVDEALELARISVDDCDRINQTLAAKKKLSPTALSLGAGFSAWSLTQSGRFFQAAIDAGAHLGDFVVENRDVIAAGWEEVVPLLPEALSELVLHLPLGSLNVASGVIYLLENHDRLIEAVNLAIEHGTDLVDAIDVVGLGADLADVAEGASTLGLSLLASWGAGYLVGSYYEPLIEAKSRRLDTLRERYGEVLKLRQAVASDLPPTVVASQLENVDSEHWAF